MENGSFILLKNCTDIEEARHLEKLLADNNIKTTLTKTTPNGVIDLSFNDDHLHVSILVKVEPENLTLAKKLMEEQAAQNIELYNTDHYLFDFSTEELKDIILKKDEWSIEDYLLSIKILADRGINLTDDKINELREQRLNELKKPEKANFWGLIFGFITAIMGGFIGLMVGWFYWRSKKTLPNGERIFTYSPGVRKTGSFLFVFGIISTTLWVMFGNFSEILFFWQNWLS